jgi:nucleotide-binding universal stress UspA family protein
MQDEPTREELTVSQQPTFSSVLVGVDGTSTGRDAIALADRLCAPSGRLTLANIVLMPSPTYHNFHATPAWRARREMLERERDAIGVVADLTGMFARSVGSGLHQLGTDCGADLLVVGSSSRGPVGRVLAGDDARGTVSGAACPSPSPLTPTQSGPMRLRPSASATTAAPRLTPRLPSRARSLPLTERASSL